MFGKIYDYLRLNDDQIKRIQLKEGDIKDTQRKIFYGIELENYEVE